MGSESSSLKTPAGSDQPKKAGKQDIQIPSCLDAWTGVAEALEEAKDSEVPDKFQRLATFGHLQVDWELVRGLSLRASLRQGGRLWLRSPVGLDASVREAIWNRSRPVKYFDMFLSHTWKTSGVLKVMSLLLQSGYKTLLLLWFCGIAIAGQLSAVGLLPLPWTFQVHIVGFQSTCRGGPWVLLAGAMCWVLGLLASPHLRWPGLKLEDDCFIDVASIHQTDPRLMERGIYGIGGFLSISRELRVLWSPAYLSRLWCVFELAAYRTANPTGKITLAPLYAEIIVYVGVAMNLAVTYVWWVSRVYFGENESECLSFGTALLPCFIAMHLLRKTYRAKHQLISNLETFDLDKVECSNDFDKEFIHGAIVEWYGSKDAFTNFVRGPLRLELLSTMASSPLLAYPLVLLTPVLSSGCTFLASLCAAGAPPKAVMAYIFGSMLSFNVCFLLSLIAFMLYVCDRFADSAGCKFRDCGKTLMLFLPIAGMMYLAGTLTRMARAQSLCACMAWFATTFLCMCLSFKCLKPLEGRVQGSNSV